MAPTFGQYLRRSYDLPDGAHELLGSFGGGYDYSRDTARMEAINRLAELLAEDE